MNVDDDKKLKIKLNKEKREKERLQELMLSEDFKLYSQYQRVEIARKFNQICKKIIELENSLGGNYAS